MEPDFSPFCAVGLDCIPKGDLVLGDGSGANNQLCDMCQADSLNPLGNVIQVQGI